MSALADFACLAPRPRRKALALSIAAVLALAGCGAANRAQLDSGLEQCGRDETCRQNRLAEFQAREDARYRAKSARLDIWPSDRRKQLSRLSGPL